MNEPIPVGIETIITGRAAPVALPQIEAALRRQEEMAKAMAELARGLALAAAAARMLAQG